MIGITRPAIVRVRVWFCQLFAPLTATGQWMLNTGLQQNLHNPEQALQYYMFTLRLLSLYNEQVKVLILKSLVQAQPSPLEKVWFFRTPCTLTDKKCDTICIHLAHGIFVENHNFLKTMKSHCAFRIIIVDNLGKIWNCWEWNGFQSWFEILMKSKTNRLVENNEIWIELRPSDVLDNAEPAFHPFSSPLV